MKYYVGLDMGTDSVGWAVTTTDYNLVRRKGRDLWGVRLIPPTETAAGRRTNRCARRRLDRRNARVGYLREIFSEEINKVDESFFQRLDESSLHSMDKSVEGHNLLFNDKDFGDKDYFEKYPTIYHLISDLIHNPERHDVRMVFLAIQDLYKHRGHFLNQNLSSEGAEGRGISEVYSELCERLAQDGEEESIALYQEEDIKWLEDILLNSATTRSDKQKKLIEKTASKSNKQVNEIWNFITGKTGNVVALFDLQDYEGKKKSFSFTDSNLDESLAEFENLNTEDNYEIILLLKEIYDISVLSKVKNGFDYLSDARIASYDKHKADLKVLKQVYRDLSPEKYEEMFRLMEDNNYSSYIGSTNYAGKIRGRQGKKFSRDEFYKRIKNDLKECPESEEKDYILHEIELDALLPKQMTSDNGVIPYQVHSKELKAILNNAEKYCPFLSVVDQTGLSIKEKIIAVFEFKMPYYVGPVTGSIGQKAANNTWSIRKENGKIYPWNIEEKIDIEKTRERFINELIKNCTYLNGEKVLPKNSLLYEEYMVLNELNNLRVNGQKLDNLQGGLKKLMFDKVFLKGKRVSEDTVRKFLASEGLISGLNKDQWVISGIDGGFANTCANYKKFADAFGVDRLTDRQREIAERVIYISTIYGDDKKLVIKLLRSEFESELDSQLINRFAGIKFKDWGQFSKEFLMLTGVDSSSKEKTIIQRMRDESKSLMELIATSEYTYRDAIEERSKKLNKSLFEIQYEDLLDSYMSAPVRRMTWQTLLILKEIVQVMGAEPEKVFVEMARGEQEKVRTESRKNKLELLYKSCASDDITRLKPMLAKETEVSLRRKKLYLYYTQQGRCMYSGETIEIDDLFNDNLYDLDHIYPRHFIKDDSIHNNLVLVKKQLNAHKTDVYPIENSIRSERKNYWAFLHEHGFINDEKYRRLTRNDEFTDEEKAAFIQRQLVETRQGTKMIADVLKNSITDGDNKLVYVKAGLVSDFRHNPTGGKQEPGFVMFPKCRMVNDLHHAADAYLNIVVGNVYNEKFTKNPLNFIKKCNADAKQYKYHMDKVFCYDVVVGEQVVWKSKGDNNSLETVTKVMNRSTAIVTRMQTTGHGKLYDTNAVCKTSANSKTYVSLKGNISRDVTKYGGYTGVATAYFFVVEHTVKKKKVRTLEQMPIMCAASIKSEGDLKQYCESQLGYSDVRVINEKILKQSVLRIDGFDVYLQSKFDDNRFTVSSAVQMKLPVDAIRYLKRIEKALEISDEKYRLEYAVKELMADKNFELFSLLCEKYKTGIFSGIPSSVVDSLDKILEVFRGLSIINQAIAISELLKLAKGKSDGILLSNKLDFKGANGKTRISKNIGNFKEVALYSYSPAGLFIKKQDLLKN